MFINANFLNYSKKIYDFIFVLFDDNKHMSV